jgi:hypothetical protein
MNARTLLNPELRKKVKHLNVNEIRMLTAELENHFVQLRKFLKFYDEEAARRRHIPGPCWLPNWPVIGRFLPSSGRGDLN